MKSAPLDIDHHEIVHCQDVVEQLLHLFRRARVVLAVQRDDTCAGTRVRNLHRFDHLFDPP